MSWVACIDIIPLPIIQACHVILRINARINFPNCLGKYMFFPQCNEAAFRLSNYIDDIMRHIAQQTRFFVNEATTINHIGG